MQYFRNRDLFKVVFNRQQADLALAFLIFVFLLVIIRHDFVVIVWLVEIDVYEFVLQHILATFMVQISYIIGINPHEDGP